MTDDVELVLAALSARGRLELEVSQLADGTLPASRRPAVEAALAGDADLRQLYDGLRAVDALLRREPDAARIDLRAMSRHIMTTIRAEESPEAVAPTLRLPAALPAMAALRTWWFTISAAAAALIVGVALGVVFMGGGSQLDVEMGSLAGRTGPAGVDAPGGAADIQGPLAILHQARQDLIDSGQSGGDPTAVAMTVSGPDVHAALDPAAIEDGLPEYAQQYDALYIIDPPSETIVATANDGPGN